ncbi:MAG: restriction endonuclease subunit R, partial [Planctomycetes bacterium]|nr:restriction endonuclease subunit R [Planctomycetota bacterium]
KDIEAETGIRFGIVEQHQFAGVTSTAADGSAQPLGADASKLLWQHLKAEGYIDAKGKVQDTLKVALREETLVLPDEREPQRDQIVHILRKLAGRLEIKNADERRRVLPREAVLDSAEFKALWDRIKYRTTYRVHFDNEKLIESCIQALREAPPIPKTRLQWRKADISIAKSGVEATKTSDEQPVVLEEAVVELPDILTVLQDRTQLTRRSIYRVLTESGRLGDFPRNPQAFITAASEAINRCKRLAIVDGIKYHRIGDEAYYAQELFRQKELVGYLKDLLEAKKSVYEQVLYDSGTESKFASDLEKNECIRLYAKLPDWFQIPTPLGSYNPDWAVLVEKDGEERLYFVVETKSSSYLTDLRDAEAAKIRCGVQHFRALEVREAPAQYRLATSVDDLLASL